MKQEGAKQISNAMETYISTLKTGTEGTKQLSAALLAFKRKRRMDLGTKWFLY